MSAFLAALRSWHQGYLTRRSVTVEFSEGPHETDKRAAWIDVEGTAAVGRLTLWESGECDTQAIGTPGAFEDHTILLRSRVLDDPGMVAVVADDLVDHVADHSRT